MFVLDYMIYVYLAFIAIGLILQFFRSFGMKSGLFMVMYRK